MSKEELIDRYLNQQLSVEELSRFKKSMESDPALAEEVRLQNQAEKLVQSIGRAQLRQQLQDFEKKKESSHRRFSIRSYWLIAAIFTLFMIGSWWIYLSSLPSPTPKSLIATYFQPYRPPIQVRGVDVSRQAWKSASSAYTVGNYQKAAEQFEIYLSPPNTQDPVAHFYAGLSHLSQQPPNTQKAAFHLKQVLLSDNDYQQQAQWYLALSYLAQNDSEQGKAFLKAIIEQQSFQSDRAKSLLEEWE